MQNNKTLMLAKLFDLEEILVIIEDARKFMSAQGSGQWQDGTPNKVTITNDIKNNNFYVCKMQNEIVGVLALLEYEEGYDKLLTGRWQHLGPYFVIHRFATKRSQFSKGVATFMLKEVEQIARKNNTYIIKVDTHEKNTPMCNLLLKNGYQVAGTTLIEQTKLRVVFEKYLG